jgi:hypothetical protein
VSKDDEEKEAERRSSINRFIIFDGTDCFIAPYYIHSFLLLVGTQHLFFAHTHNMEVASIEVTGTSVLHAADHSIV